MFLAVSAGAQEQAPNSVSGSDDPTTITVGQLRPPPAPVDAPKAKKKEKKKRKKDGAAGALTERKPTLTLGPVVLDFSARLEGEMRPPTVDIGRDHGRAEWQDRRFGVEGTVFKRIKFEVSRELTSDFESTNGVPEKTPWRDVNVGAQITKGLNVQGGRFKLPFGREALTGETNLDFVYRSLAARVLSPGRDTGVMSHGRLFNRRVQYQVGYFTRDGDNSRTVETEGGRDSFVTHVVLSPFAARDESALSTLQIGIATSQSQLDQLLGVRGRTVLGDGVFFDRVYVNGRRQRVGVEAAWTNGPFGLSSEYITVSDQRKGMGFDGEDLPVVTAAAWYVAGTWAITGEHKHGRLEPRRDLLRSGLGAFELSARIERLRFQPVEYPGSDYAFPGRSDLAGNADTATTLGVNWYLNRYLKVQGNIIRESIDDPQRSPAPAASGRFTSTVVLVQFRY